jgi:hypothetical protein
MVRKLSAGLRNGVFWDVTPIALVRTDVSDELNASFIGLTRIGELALFLVHRFL